MQNKKILKVVTILLVVIALFILLGSVLKRYASGAWMMGRADRSDSTYYYPSQDNQYAFPFDAIRTGKIALKIADSELFVQEVKNVADRQAGEVVFYELNNATSRTKNGTIVVKVADDKFEDTFSQLKSRGDLVVQEFISKQENGRNVCPMLSPQEGIAPTATVLEGDGSQAAAEGTKPELISVPSGDQAASSAQFAPYCPIGDKDGDFSYIKVVFMADKGVSGFLGKNGERYLASMTLEKMGKWILVIVAIKILVTLAFIGFIIMLLVQFFRHTVVNHHRHYAKPEAVKRRPEIKTLSKRSAVVVKRKVASKAKTKK